MPCGSACGFSFTGIAHALLLISSSWADKRFCCCCCCYHHFHFVIIVVLISTFTVIIIVTVLIIIISSSSSAPDDSTRAYIWLVHSMSNLSRSTQQMRHSVCSVTVHKIRIRMQETAIASFLWTGIVFTCLVAKLEFFCKLTITLTTTWWLESIVRCSSSCSVDHMALHSLTRQTS